MTSIDATAATARTPEGRALGDEARRALRGLGWNGLAQGLGLVLRLASNILMARWLAPESYGVLGTALAVLTTLEWLADLGILPGLLRHPRGTEPAVLRTGWWMGLGRGLAITTAALLLAGPASAFAREPALAWVLAGIALRPALIALRSPAAPLLRRELNYRAVCIEEVVQTAVGTSVSLALAWATRSIAAIVVGNVAGAVSSVVVSYALAPMRPAFAWDRDAARELGQFGRSILRNTLAMALWMNLDRMIGLRWLGPVEMGIYAVAWNLAMVAETLLARGFDVYLSMLVRIHDPHARAERHEAMARRLTGYAMPVAAVGMALAPAVIGVLYDDRYAAARLPFAILTARLAVRGLSQLQFQYLLAQAHVAVATRAYLAALAAQVLLLALLVPPLGATGMAWAALGSTAVLALVQTVQLGEDQPGERRRFVATLAWSAAGLSAALLIG